MTPILCTGRDGTERTFICEGPEIEQDLDGEDVQHFFVKTKRDDDFFFQLTLKAKQDGELRISEIDHSYRPEYMAKGIPDSVIPFLARNLKTRICSSRPLVVGTTERRSIDAEKMWARMTAKGIARYFPDEQIYRTVEPLTE